MLPFKMARMSIPDDQFRHCIFMVSLIDVGTTGFKFIYYRHVPQ